MSDKTPDKAALSWMEIVQTIGTLAVAGGTLFLVGSEAGWW